MIFARRVRREESEARLDLPGLRLDYLLKRSSARRSLALKINPQGRAQVNAPLAMPMAHIEAFLLRHADWLLRHLEARPAGLEWVDGMRLPYLGSELQLNVLPAMASLPRAAVHPFPPVGKGLVERGYLICHAPDIETFVLAWYRSQAKALLGERLATVCREFGMPLPAWRLSNARTRWGSLSAKGVIGLNWRLVKAGTPEIDYVICHELAHFRHRDHSPAFWREVARLFPDYLAVRARLKAAATDYMAF